MQRILRILALDRIEQDTRIPDGGFGGEPGCALVQTRRRVGISERT